MSETASGAQPASAAEIAGRLTEAQRRAVLSLPANGVDRYDHDKGMGGALAAARRAGLVEPSWHWSARVKPWRLTPLGLAVRAHLEGTRP